MKTQNQNITGKIIGKRLPDGSYEKQFYRQGFVYKNFGNFQKKEGICYVSELSDEEYTYEDFFELCGGNIKMAEHVFESVDWQNPESLIECDLANIGVIPCSQCSYLYDTENQNHCPQCGTKKETG